MTILETLAVFVGAPLLIYVITAALTVIPGRARKHPRYRAGQQWDYPPQWWAGDTPVAPIDAALTAGPEGGARGTW